jgi:DNA-binding Lrp family transcriptional regulator
VDPLDFAIYRALSPNGEARFWAGRRVIDPRVPARAIAEAVGLSENGVRRRLAVLAARGYLRGSAAVPNPALFGARIWVVELPIRTAGEVAPLYRDLSLVDGVVFARDTLDEGERAVHVYFAADSDAAAARRGALVRRLTAGTAEAVRPYWIPPPELTPSPLDWRVLDAVVRAPDASVAETARAVGVSVKTTARKLRQLVDAHAVWWTHGPASEEFPLALLRLALKDPSGRRSVTDRIRSTDLPWMPVARDGGGIEPSDEATELAGLVPADAPAALERAVEDLAALPVVGRVHRTFALGSRVYPGWAAERLAAHRPARRAGAVRRGRATRSGP